MYRYRRIRIFQLVFIFLVATAWCRAEKPAFKELEAKTADVTLYVRIAGDPNPGNVLIAINGGPGISSRYMLNLESLASPAFAVVTYDQRGVGHSTSPPEKESSYTLQKYVADLEAVRKTVGVDNVHVLGHSWGGIVAMRYAAAHPGNVRSLVLVGSGPPTWEGLGKAQMALVQKIQKLQKEGIMPENIQWGDPKAILPAYFSDPKFRFLPLEKGGASEYNNTVGSLTMSALRGFDFTADAAGINLPVLILIGEDDPFGMPIAREIRDALAKAKVTFIILKKCGHFWHECPEAFAHHVRPFLGISK